MRPRTTSLKTNPVALAVALALVAGCGGGSSPTTPPVTTPSPAPTPTPTPSATPTPVATSCRYGVGTVDTSCARINNPTFIDDVDAAINLLGQQRSELFNFNDSAGDGAWRVLDADAYFAGVIANLQAKDYCAGFDLQNLQVKNSNTFSEDYDILLSDGHVRRGASIYRQTCSPANFPLDPKDVIDSIRVAFFGFRCPDGVAVPRNLEGKLPIGCQGNLTATPKNKDGGDVDPRVHGTQIAWTLEQEGNYVQRIDYPDQPFNKSLLGLSLGHFTMCAVVKERQGCLNGEVVSPSPQ